MPLRNNHKKFVGPLIFATFLLALGYLVFGLLSPARTAGPETRSFEIKQGEGFRGVVKRLRDERLIRSPLAFSVLSLATGAALHLKPGIYELERGMSGPKLLHVLVSGAPDISVRVPEGASFYEIDRLLSQAGVLPGGSLIEHVRSAGGELEGKLFPDTYRFSRNTKPADVAARLLANFEKRTSGLFDGLSETKAREVVIMASLLEREIPDFEERRTAAGILAKRARAGMPLQVDATICYIKEMQRNGKTPCHPVTAKDLSINSPYNTYLVKGLPPGAIGNPGLEAINAALDPAPSPYWYYLSDLETGKTVFSQTLAEHNRNRERYLSGD